MALKFLNEYLEGQNFSGEAAIVKSEGNRDKTAHIELTVKGTVSRSEAVSFLQANDVLGSAEPGDRNLIELAKRLEGDIKKGVGRHTAYARGEHVEVGIGVKDVQGGHRVDSTAKASGNKGVGYVVSDQERIASQARAKTADVLASEQIPYPKKPTWLQKLTQGAGAINDHADAVNAVNQAREVRAGEHKARLDWEAEEAKNGVVARQVNRHGIADVEVRTEGFFEAKMAAMDADIAEKNRQGEIYTATHFRTTTQNLPGGRQVTTREFVPDQPISRLPTVQESWAAQQRENQRLHDIGVDLIVKTVGRKRVN